MSALLTALVEGQGFTKQEAKEEIEEMRERVLQDGDNPEEVLYEYGLEPDYIFDLLF